MSKTTMLTERNKMMAYVLYQEGCLMSTHNAAGARIFCLTETAQDALEKMLK